jgi:hypothetical protein
MSSIRPIRAGMHLQNKCVSPAGQLDAAHALAANIGQGHLDAAAIANTPLCDTYFSTGTPNPVWDRNALQKGHTSLAKVR